MKKYLAIGAAAIVSGMAIQATALDSNYDPAAVIYYSAPLSSDISDYAHASSFGLQLHHSSASVFKINPYARKSRLKPILDLQLNSQGLQDFKSNGVSVLRRDYSLNAEGGIAGIDWAVLVAGVVAAGVVAETVSDDDEEEGTTGTTGTTGSGTTGGGGVAGATSAVTGAVTGAASAVTGAVTGVASAVAGGTPAAATAAATSGATAATGAVTSGATGAAGAAGGVDVLTRGAMNNHLDAGGHGIMGGSGS